MPTTDNELDFWSDDIRVEVLSPLMILRAQIPALRKKTKGVLQAKVESYDTVNETIHDFFLVAPALDNYKEKILIAKHNHHIVYPCTLVSAALSQTFLDEDGDEQRTSLRQTWSEAEFVACLKEALSSGFVRSTIDSLLAKSNEVRLESGAATSSLQAPDSIKA